MASAISPRRSIVPDASTTDSEAKRSLVAVLERKRTAAVSSFRRWRGHSQGVRGRPYNSSSMRRITLGADKTFDARTFMADLRGST